MMEIVVLIGNFNRVKLNRLRNGGSVFSKKPKLGSVTEVRNPTLDSCIGEHYMQNAFHQVMGAQAVKLAGAPAVDRGPWQFYE